MKKFAKTISVALMAMIITSTLVWYGCRKENDPVQNGENSQLNASNSMSGKSARQRGEGNRNGVMFPSDVQANRQIDDFIKLVGGQMSPAQYESRDMDVASWVIEATSNFNFARADSGPLERISTDSINIPLTVVNGKISPADMVSAYNQIVTFLTKRPASTQLIMTVFVDLELLTTPTGIGKLHVEADFAVVFPCGYIIKNGALYDNVTELEKCMNTAIFCNNPSRGICFPYPAYTPGPRPYFTDINTCKDPNPFCQLDGISICCCLCDTTPPPSGNCSWLNPDDATPNDNKRDFLIFGQRNGLPNPSIFISSAADMNFYCQSYTKIAKNCIPAGMTLISVKIEPRRCIELNPVYRECGFGHKLTVTYGKCRR